MHKQALVATLLLAMSMLGYSSSAAAQPVPHNHGEISQGAEMPTQQALLSILRSGSPSAIGAALEYSEAATNYTAILPELQRLALSNDSAFVREMSMWRIKKNPFFARESANMLRTVLTTDTDAVRRSRAADALGELQSWRSLPAMREQLGRESDASVRISIVRAAARINAPAGHDLVSGGLRDADASVRLAAFSTILDVNFFRDEEGVLAGLGDSDVRVRQRAAGLVGVLSIEEGADALIAMLSTETDRAVLQSAAISLGRLGGHTAELTAARARITDSLVRDAIDTALRMR